MPKLAGRGDDAEPGIEQEDEEHARDRGRYRIGPDQQGLVDPRGRDQRSAITASKQRKRRARGRPRAREHEGDADRMIISRSLEQLGVILEPDELGREAERVLTRKDRHSACAAGQKKKTSVTRSCGASRR